MLTDRAADDRPVALVGLQMGADRINKNGGINGRPVQLVIADDDFVDETQPLAGQPVIDVMQARLGQILRLWLLCGVAFGLVAACALPRSGPTRSEIVSGAADPTSPSPIIEVDERVVAATAEAGLTEDPRAAEEYTGGPVRTIRIS